MQTIQIDNNEIEHFIKNNYGNDTTSLLNDFIIFAKTELLSNEIKKGFDEVKEFDKGNINLSDANNFLSELKSEY